MAIQRPESGKPLAAIGLLLAGVCAFGVMDAMTKMVIPGVTPAVIVWLRYVVALATVAIMLPTSAWGRARRINRPHLLVLRGLLPVITSLLAVVALGHMAVAEFTALVFTAPFFVTVLSIPLLGERVGRHRWSALALGFGGVLLIIQPHPDMSVYSVLPLIAATLFALYLVSTRMASVGADAHTMLLYMMMTGVIATSAIVPFFWAWPTPAEAGIIALLGILYAVAQLCITRAFAISEASRLTPFIYVQIIAAGGFAYVAYDEVPGPLALLGTLIIIASGLYVWQRERRLARAAAGKPSGGCSQRTEDLKD